MNDEVRENARKLGGDEDVAILDAVERLGWEVRTVFANFYVAVRTSDDFRIDAQSARSLLERAHMRRGR